MNIWEGFRAAVEGDAPSPSSADVTARTTISIVGPAVPRGRAPPLSGAHRRSRLARPAHRAVNEPDCRKALVARAMDAAASAAASLGNGGIDNMLADSVVKARI